jgi:16S rRNA (guanine966-N2)-methyltransferase
MKQRNLRIIGGNWRGRKVSFADRAEIRPTPNRVRETLFNWLAPYIRGRRCLEPFAGSGILSMEALSRGAASVTVLDRDAPTLRHCQAEFERFADAARYRCIRADASRWLARCNEPAFDLVFLDPPFASGILPSVCAQLVERELLTPDGLLYLETSSGPDVDVERRFEVVKAGAAGDVRYGLWRLRDL